MKSDFLSEASELETIREWDERYVMRTYARQAPLFVRGEKARLYDSEGKEYLDFLAGIAVCSLGHSHPRLIEAISKQAAQLMHTSNLYLTAPMAKLAKKLCEISGFEKVFFCNSGTEANEAALKIARKRSIVNKSELAFEVVSLTGSFHGRTLGSLSLTAQPKYQEPFGPMPAGVRYVERNNEQALRQAVNENTAAIFIEPIQGESGVHPIEASFLQLARELCDRFDALLVFDEIQCGIGRTGSWLAFQRMGVLPDLFTLAKGLGGGFPIGAVVARGEGAYTLAPGDHGSTFAANALASSAALCVLETIEEENLLQNAREVGEQLKRGLLALSSELPIKEARGVGLMLGVELKAPMARDLARECLNKGLILNATGDTTLRLLPPLIVNAQDVELALSVLRDAFKSLNPAE